MHARTFGPPERGDSEDIWRRAQEVLPSNRRRPFDPMTCSKMNSERRKGRVVEPPTSAPVETAPLQSMSKDWKDIIPPSIEQAEETTVASLLVDTVLRALYDPRLRAALRNLVAETLTPESDLQQEQAITWRQPKTPKERLPRVVIAGGRTHMRESLQGLNNVDLRFWGTTQGESPARLHALLQGADTVFLMVNDVNHKAQQAVRDREKLGRIKAMYWTRPYSELRGVLQMLNIDNIQTVQNP